MKKIKLLFFLFLLSGIFIQSKSFGQQLIQETFSYTLPAYIGGNGAAGSTSNNWTTHSVTAGQTTTIDLIAGSLTYPGLQTSAGDKLYFFSNANATSRDVNRPITTTSNVCYFSALINIVDNSQLTAAGDYFLHFGATAGTTVTIFGGRFGAKSSGTGFRFIIQNTSGGTPTFTDNGADLVFGNTYLIVVKYDKSTNPTTASFWVNPTSLGGTEPTGSFTNTSGTSTFATFASICLRENATTPKAEIDEIRVGETWADVTPVGTGTPTVTVAPATLSGFTYIVGNGPSPVQSYIVSGTNLTNNISIALPVNYELSLSNSPFTAETSAITLTQTGGTVASTTIYVRLKAGLSVATYDENINITSTGATPKTVACSGSVTCLTPSQPSTITGSATPCQGSSQNYSVTNVAGVSYAWTFPTGWTQTAGGTTNAITVTVGSGTGNITVTPSNSCGNGTAQTLAVTPSSVPSQPSSITGAVAPCQGSSQNYSVTNVAGVSYTWTFPTGWTQTAGGTTNAITVTVGSGTGNITVTPSNTCGNGTAQTLAVTPSSVPAQPGSITGAAAPCQGSSQNYSVTNVAGVSYAWTFPTGWTQTAGGTTNAITVTVGSGTGNITVTPSNTCGNGTAQTLAVNPTDVPLQPSIITGNATPYFGTSEVYSVTNVAGVTYTWTFPTGWVQTAGGTTNSVTVTIGSGSGSVSCTPSNTCGNGTARTLTVTVYGVGITKFNDNKNIRFIPNPTSGITNLNLKDFTGDMNISIKNIQGGLMFTEKIIVTTDNYIKTLDLTKYADGMYYIQIENNGKTYVQKVVKQ